ncbi:hypothetical protein AB0A05_26970 [Streptomyces sp. NPDC046374]|uniref:hypothetical protein n=1 Tax=Streptomyces sp. NPDC046374 TaxID=3154917 RepID=UPI0033E8BC6B
MADEIPHQGRITHPSLQSESRTVFLRSTPTIGETLALIGGITLAVCVVLGWASVLVAHVLTPAWSL